MPRNHVYRRNRPIFELPESHAAHRFLRAFIKCRNDCVGKEIPWPEEEQLAVDQEWFSATDSRRWKFSGFAYTYLSFDIELDGWLNDSPTPTAGETSTIEKLPYLRSLLAECKSACIESGNTATLAMVAQVDELFDLWEDCIRVRWRQIGYAGSQ